MVRGMKSPGFIALRSSVALALLTLALLSLASCSQTSLNPVDWYHSIEGGKVADERPPPPRSDAPYPNLGSVPARPAPIDAQARNVIARGLVADRTNAQYSASLAPLPPANPANRPVPPTPRAAGEEATSASLPAASAPPPQAAAAARPVGPLGPPQPPLADVPGTAPRRAPTQPVQSSALPPPAAAPAADPSKPAQDVGARADVVMAQGRPAEPQAGLPTVPTMPPRPPMLPGAPSEVAPVAAPKALPAPVAVSPAPVPATPASMPDPALGQSGAVLIAFATGSSELPPNALVSLKLMSQQRAGNPIAITGFGDLLATDAAAQSNALPLALERARVVASRLQALGVPAGSIRVNAEAQGRGAAARIIR